MRSHKNLEVWKQSIVLVKQIYNLTGQFPREELYGITSQMRRCAVSVPSNIAEGAARNSKREFIYYLIVARGSLSELETQLIISQELDYFQDKKVFDQLKKVFALLSGLITSLKKSNVKERE